MGDLIVNQTFAANAGRISDRYTGDFDVTTAGGVASTPSITIEYNAGMNSYTVSDGAVVNVVTPAMITTNDAWGTIYIYPNATSPTASVSLLKKPLLGTIEPRYVRMGVWETGAGNDFNVNMFTYGLSTPSTAVPRVGQGVFDVEVFGVTTHPNTEPRSFAGGGLFKVDFDASVFSTEAYVEETEFFSGGGNFGGGIKVVASGKVGSSGSLTGLVHYGGMHASAAGQLAGRFYGPAGQEMGAAFSAQGANGSTATGAIVGVAQTSPALFNLALTNIRTTESFGGWGAGFVATTSGGVTTLNPSEMGHSIELRPTDPIVIRSGASNYPNRSYDESQRVAGPANFKSYAGPDGSTLGLYTIGPANSELALTYAGMGRWSGRSTDLTELSTRYFVFGMSTPSTVLAGRTGSAHYQGVAYGLGNDTATNSLYEVRGTSTFDVNFSNASLSSTLNLTRLNGGGASTIGTYTFAGPIAYPTLHSPARAELSNDPAGIYKAETLDIGFYGPSGEEIAGRFKILLTAGSPVPPAWVEGVTVAKMQ